MLCSCRVVVAVLTVVLSAVLTSAQTTVYFTASSTAGAYPATCTTGSLSCSVSGSTYTCTGGTVSGTHYYYPASTAPTFVSALVAGQPATICEQYTADYKLPLTAGGLNVQYGTSSLPVCVNYRLRNSSTTVIIADPDAVEAYPLNFNYSTTASSVPSCPTPVAATGSGSATVYFTYLGVPTTNGTGVSICASGSLSCTYYGNNQYYCPTLNSGTHYMYNYSTSSYQTVSLTSETECNGFGDGYLPLDYEGISFAGSFSSSFNCISWYGFSGGSKQGYDFYSSGSLNSYTDYGGSQSFTYTTAQTTAYSACSAYIPGLSQSSSALPTAHTSLLMLLATAVVAVLAMRV